MDQDNNGEMEHGHSHDDGHDHSHDTQATPAAPVAPAAASTDAADTVSDHKLYAILGYILPFLFFLPMVQDSSKNNAFARFHANQQLTLLVIWTGVYVISHLFYSMLSMGVFFLMPIINLAILVLAILGIINAAQGEMKELPLVGKINLLNKLFK